MVLSTEDIKLWLPHRWYPPGEIVHGVVQLHLSEPTKISNIQVLMEGFERSTFQHFYCTKCVTVYEKGDELQDALPKGQHSFQFRFRLDILLS